MKKAKVLISLMTLFVLLSVNSVEAYPGYNSTNARDYAYTYYKDYNPNYNSYNSDCANFVSQCIHAGGVAFTDQWYMKRKTFLGIHTGWDTTNKWTVAWDLASYIHSQGWHTSTGGSYDLSEAPRHNTSIKIGAVVLYKFNHSHGGYHVALVTQNNWLQGTNITQHTTDRKDVAYNYDGILTTEQQKLDHWQYFNMN